MSSLTKNNRLRTGAEEAQSHADDDRRKVEVINARNEAERTIYEIEKLLKEHESKIGESEKSAVRAAVERCKQEASKDDPQAIRQAVSDLHTAAQSLARYVQGDGSTGGAGAEAGAGAGAGQGGKGPDDVIDAEFEVKK